MTRNDKKSVQKARKLVVVGDGDVGKTCLLHAFKNNEFHSLHRPTIFETYASEIQLEGQTLTLALFDTAGQDAYARLRPLSYSDTHVVLICFSVDSPASITNVIEVWNPEIRHFCCLCPVILVACKIDLRTDCQIIEKLKERGDVMITDHVGRQMAAQIEADAYMECSAKTREGVDDLFIHAARLSLKKKSRSSSHRKCVLC